MPQSLKSLCLSENYRDYGTYIPYLSKISMSNVDEVDNIRRRRPEIILCDAIVLFAPSLFMTSFRLVQTDGRPAVAVVEQVEYRDRMIGALCGVP